MPRDTVRLLDEDDLIRWREGTMTALPSKDEPGGAHDAITHSNLSSAKLPTLTDFHKANIQLRADTKTSLLTKALQPSQDDNNDETYMAIDMARNRSSRSTTSSASTADLTSDGGLTSPTRTSTPSPPFPPSSYMSLAPYTLGPKLSQTAFARTQQKGQDPALAQQVAAAAVPKPDPAVEALVKKRCISFACAAQKPLDFIKSTPSTTHAKNATSTTTTTAPKRTIKFACNGPQPDRQAVKVVEPAKIARLTATPASPAKPGRHTIRSPTLSRKLRSSTPQPKAHRDSTSTIRRASQSPAAVRSRKPKYIVADEEALESSEATRFHEFASDEPQEDDWIRKDTSTIKGKLTIHDTLKKENAIRQLGKEAEEEALEDDEDDDDDDEGNDDDDDDENDDDDDDDDEDDDEDDEDDEDDNTVDGSDVDLDASDGNETDNEAGFADSDEESDRGGEFHFWSPGMSTGEASAFRSTGRRAPSESSIDSLSHMSPTLNRKGGPRKSKGTRKIRIRPGTPDLPDSTDFVCGTLDEDRPLEEAYVSCMEARKREKRHVIPQDIDPSFPTSDPEDEEDENDEAEKPNDSDEGIWLHGKFEDSESETRHRRSRTRKSPKHSPKRLVSPPPQKYRSPPATTTRRSPRLRSPPPRRAKSPPPRRAKSPPPARARAVKWPTASASISFAPIPNRPDPTHTKSLPRRPNAFCQQYRAAQLAFANDEDNDNNTDGYTRGAIDIVKGLEQKRQRRKDKFFSKLCNRARKGQQVERRPQPGKGAERMRELGLQMAGKTVDYRGANAEYVLSV
ncbi:hypothetical protein VE01_02068 [Pseudogymnoascus verrucosus]|uniref:Uncharacterized protein n=1 Tax=Pseudogymnoascus verrucosus TaxID=342668 RepID=A0A1B8GV52_9PEZI|nr:uncharacterized protein VE01_02068 [Pseudogymnoascus verrucosus]OBT99703.1 hypothetical protein VE01_02068 [Pseudogymnoascus verrucosus]